MKIRSNALPIHFRELKLRKVYKKSERTMKGNTDGIITLAQSDSPLFTECEILSERKSVIINVEISAAMVRDALIAALGRILLLTDVRFVALSVIFLFSRHIFVIENMI